MLAFRALRDIREIITTYQLHDTIPVDIASAARQDGWEIEYTDQLTKLLGLAVIYKSWRQMAIATRIPPAWQRLATAHEWAHEIAGHEDTIYMMSASPLWNNQQEHEADVIAAELLIPNWVLRECRTLEEVARRCDVPVELVDIRTRRVIVVTR